MGFTDVFKLRFMDPSSPLRTLDTVTREMAQSIEAALLNRGSVPTGYDTLVAALAARVTPLEERPRTRRFADLAARNAYYSGKTIAAGETCATVINGELIPMMHDGNGWRFTLQIAGQYSTNADGVVVIQHNAGQPPRRMPTVGLQPSTNEAQNAVVKVMAWFYDATQIQCRFYRHDQNAAFNNPGLGLSLTAQF